MRDVAVGLLVVAATALLLAMNANQPQHGPATPGSPEPGASAELDISRLGPLDAGTRVSASSAEQPGAQHPYLAWANTVGPRVGIPPRALAAYAAAERAVHDSSPGCRLSWVTLAGIGAVESGHGTHGAATIRDDGGVRPQVIGPALDGSADLGAVSDTDDGSLDGDTAWDRAVGPMQFLPQTWADWGSDADEDGSVNPHSLDDASLAAARYLCASGQDTATGEGWADAVFSYNHSTGYVRQVYAHAQMYAALSR